MGQSSLHALSPRDDGVGNRVPRHIGLSGVAAVDFGLSVCSSMVVPAPETAVIIGFMGVPVGRCR